MKRLLVGCLPLLLVSTACSDEADGAGEVDADGAGEVAADGAGEVAADALVETTSDAPGAAELPDATPANARVRVLVQQGAGTPAVLTNLIVHAADGSVFGSALSDGNGMALLEVPPGGMVTSLTDDAGVGSPSSPGTGAFTITDVRDGDLLRLPGGNVRQPLLGGLLNTDTSVNVKLPGPFAGASGYRVEAKCANDASVSDLDIPVTVIFESACAHGRLDLFAWAIALDGRPLAATFINDVDWLQPTPTMPAWTPLADLQSFSATLDNAPAGATLDVFRVDPLRDAELFRTPTGASLPAKFDQDGHSAIATRYDERFIDTLAVSVLVLVPGADSDYLRAIQYRRIDPTRAPAVALSLAETDVQLPLDVQWHAGDGLAASSVTWTLPAPGAAAPDALKVEAIWYEEVNGDQIPHIFGWLLPPGNPGSLAFPELPPAFAAWLPSDAGTRVVVRVSALHSERAISYREVVTELGLAVATPATDFALLLALGERSYLP